MNRLINRQSGVRWFSVVVASVACSSVPAAQDGVSGSSSNAITIANSDGGWEMPSASSASSAVSNSAMRAPLSGDYTAGSFVQINPGVAFGTVLGGGDASPWVIGGPPNNLYHYNNDSAPPRLWVQEDNSAASCPSGIGVPNSSQNTFSLSVSPEGTPWKIDSNHHVWEHAPDPGCWISRGSPFQAYEIGVGPNEDVWAISTTKNAYGDYLIYRWVGGSWQLQPGAGQHVAVAPDDSTTWVSNGGGEIWKWVNGSWQDFGNCVRNVGTGGAMGTPVMGAGPNDALWVVGCDAGTEGTIWAWHSQGSFWEQVAGSASNITVTADGTPWIADANLNLYEYISVWQPIGPWGFVFNLPGANQTSVHEIMTGEIRDVDASLASSTITVGALSGGVWQNRQSLAWVSIADRGAGASARRGPVNSVGTIATKLAMTML